jgi:putative heme-binding domain-containing protein
MNRLTSKDTPPRIKGFVLRLIPPDNGRLKMDLLLGLLDKGDEVLSLEVVRTLSAQRTKVGRAVLADLAANTQSDEVLRLESIAGLASSPEEHLELLLKLAGDPMKKIREEALRAMRFVPLSDEQKAMLAEAGDGSALVNAVLNPSSLIEGRPAISESGEWLKRIDAVPGEADVEAGRRIYFQGRVAICATCHRHSGRGTIVGPELSFVGQQGDREEILRSILEPNREVAPQYYPTQVTMKDGTVFTGILLRAGGTSGKEYYRDLTGREQSFAKEDIAGRAELKMSLMPGGLVGTLTDEELRDLLAFLMASGT